MMGSVEKIYENSYYEDIVTTQQVELCYTQPHTRYNSRAKGVWLNRYASRYRRGLPILDLQIIWWR